MSTGLRLCCMVLALAWCAGAAAVDPDLLQKYRAYQGRQQVQQTHTLEQARAAALSGDFAEAKRQVDAARNLAYSPAEVAAVESLIASEQQRRETERQAALAAQRERERQAALAAEQERARQAEAERVAQEARRAREAAAAQASAAVGVGSGSGASASATPLESSLDWNYDYRSIQIPPVYETQLKERGIFFKELVMETRQTHPGYTSSTLEKVYFSVHLQNNTDRPKQVVYKIKAREQFSVGRTTSNAVNAGFWALAGAGLASMLGADPEAGAALGAAGAVAHQGATNQWFEKEKTFTVTLPPHTQVYQTGWFPVSKRLSDAPTLEILSAD